MSRSGYDNWECDWYTVMWRGAVKSAFRGRRGQAFLREMLTALDRLPERRLTKNKLEIDGEVCALGALGRDRGLDMSQIDSEDPDTVASQFDVARAMACEIMFENDEGASDWWEETPEQRFSRMRAWVASNIK